MLYKGNPLTLTIYQDPQSLLTRSPLIFKHAEAVKIDSVVAVASSVMKGLYEVVTIEI